MIDHFGKICLLLPIGFRALQQYIVEPCQSGKFRFYHKCNSRLRKVFYSLPPISGYKMALFRDVLLRLKGAGFSFSWRRKYIVSCLKPRQDFQLLKDFWFWYLESNVWKLCLQEFCEHNFPKRSRIQKNINSLRSLLFYLLFLQDDTKSVCRRNG